MAAYQALDFMSTVAENIGNSMELTFPVVLNVSASSTINSILGWSNHENFPLSNYFPATEAQMYQSGLAHAENIVAAASPIADEINVAQVIYYRVDARNYANLYTSNATSTYNGSGTLMNPNYYNKNYVFHVDADCANFVSQAIHYGGIATTTIWQPQTYAWCNAQGLISYFRDTVKMIQVSDFTSCAAGGIIGCMRSSSDLCDHVVMCVLNDTVNRAYPRGNRSSRWDAADLL